MQYARHRCYAGCLNTFIQGLITTHNLFFVFFTKVVAYPEDLVEAQYCTHFFRGHDPVS